MWMRSNATASYIFLNATFKRNFVVENFIRDILNFKLLLPAGANGYVHFMQIYSSL